MEFNPWSRKIPHAVEQRSAVGHNYWACALKPMRHSYWSLCPLESVLCNQEKPPQCEDHVPAREKPAHPTLLRLEDKCGARNTRSLVSRKYDKQRDLCAHLSGRWVLKVEETFFEGWGTRVVQEGKWGRGGNLWNKRGRRIIIPSICREFYNFIQCFAL